jgi:hypothetical protein
MSKGYGASETKASVDQARSLIEQAEAFNEPLEDPFALFSILYGLWIANFVAFRGEEIRRLAAQFLALAKQQKVTVPLMIGHRLTGMSLFYTGDIVEGWEHYNRALSLYDPGEHRIVATQFGQDIRVAILCVRAVAAWLMGYPLARSKTPIARLMMPAKSAKLELSCMRYSTHQ